MKTNNNPKRRISKKEEYWMGIREVRKMNSFPAIEIKEGEEEREH